MDTRQNIVIMALAMVLAGAAAAMAQSTPPLVNYQGKLLDSGGTPITDPTAPIEFLLWDKDVTTENVLNEEVMMGGTAAHALARQDLVPGSEVVTGPGGVPTYSTPNDYLIDYAAGAITRVPTGFILDGETVEIDYDWTSYGSLLWSESQLVNVEGGLYSTALGLINPLDSSLLTGATVFLEVVVDGSTLTPRQRLTSVPFALVADRLDGLDATDFSLAGHTHDFSGITGVISDAQVPDNITIVYAADAGSLGGQLPEAYVSVSGDTVTGDLEIGQDLIVQGDAAILGGNIGLGVNPVPAYGIINASVSPPNYGAELFGSVAAVRGEMPLLDNTYGILGQDGAGVVGSAGLSTTPTPQYGGNFTAMSDVTAYGVSGQSASYGAADGAIGVNGYASAPGAGYAAGGEFTSDTAGTGVHYGVYALGQSSSPSAAYASYNFALNTSSGPAMAGYFYASPSGTGTHYGVWASAKDYAGWFQDGKVRVGNGGTEDYVDGNGDLYVQDELEADGNAYVGGDLAVLGDNVGLGTIPSSTYGITNNSVTAPIYGAYLYGDSYGVLGALASNPTDHYGYLGSTTYGVYAQSGNSAESGPRYGGRFLAESQGNPYGVYAEASSHGGANSYGVVGYGGNDSTGWVYGGLFYTSSQGSGNHYGVYASSNEYGVYGSGGSQGIYGELSSDPADHYGYLGSLTYGAYARAGNSDETTTRYGGVFSAYTQSSSYGVLGNAYSYGTANARGVEGYAYNNSTGNAMGGYFYTANTGTGTHYGVYAYSSDYGLYVSSGTKNWVNPDPEDPDQAIAYVTVESGENVTYLAARGRLTSGRAEIMLPDHFRKVTSPDFPVIVTATPRERCNGLMVTYSDNERIVVEELMDGTSDAEFDYMVKGIRLGYEDYEPIIDNVDYVPFQGNHANMDESQITTQEWYDQQSNGLKRIFKTNGTLDNNGKVNEAAFKARGWKEVKERAPGSGPGKE